MKKMIAVVIVATLLIISVFSAQQSRKTDQWIHRTFQGTVSEMWDSGEIVKFTLISHVNGNEYNFEAYKEAISSIFEVLKVKLFALSAMDSPLILSNILLPILPSNYIINIHRTIRWFFIDGQILALYY